MGKRLSKSVWEKIGFQVYDPTRSCEDCKLSDSVQFANTAYMVSGFINFIFNTSFFDLEYCFHANLSTCWAYCRFWFGRFNNFAR